MLQVVETWSQWAVSGLLLHTSFRQQAMGALQQLADMLHTSQATHKLVSLCFAFQLWVYSYDPLVIGAMVSVRFLWCQWTNKARASLETIFCYCRV